MMEENLIWVADKTGLEQAGIRITPGTLRKWHSIKKHPRLFVKLWGKLYIRESVWREEVKKQIDITEQTAKKIYKLKNTNYYE